jgi:hypothetical protein
VSIPNEDVEGVTQKEVVCFTAEEFHCGQGRETTEKGEVFYD